MRPAWLRFLCTGVIAHPALCTEYPRFRKIGDTAYRRERERERELSRPEAMVARCPEAALWNRWSPFMTAARVRVPNWRNVRSLALQRSVARSGTIHGSLPQPRAGRRPTCRGTVLPHARGRERERKRTRCSNLSSDLRAQWFVPVFQVQRTQQQGHHPAGNSRPMMSGSAVRSWSYFSHRSA